MVELKGFPGPLYPPDHAKGPSASSDYVIAIKRTAARLGAWPWNPNGWDDVYSNGFAHGDGWDHPTHAGIEGLQKWGSLDATGSFGEKTFNFLRSVKIGQGMPHAGEMAMDSVCVNLFNAAYLDVQPPKVLRRQLVLDRAIAKLGVKESPPESNQCEFTAWYGMVGPWCAMFVSWCYDGPGGPQSNSFDRWDERYAYVPYVVADAREGRVGLSVVSHPEPGDLVCYDWQWNNDFDHIGVFEKWVGGHSFNAIEGNTSLSNDSNGGEVMRRTRDVNDQATVFVRVAE